MNEVDRRQDPQGATGSGPANAAGIIGIDKTGKPGLQALCCLQNNAGNYTGYDPTKLAGVITMYHLRRKDKAIESQEQIDDILARGKFASIAMCRDNEPYIVTLNYGYDDGMKSLYFHCARKGLKLDFVRGNPAVCATIIEDRGYKTGECDHGYRSLVIFGKMFIVEDLADKKNGIDFLLRHLEDNPDPIRERNLKDDGDYAKVGILRLDINSITGKQGL